MEQSKHKAERGGSKRTGEGPKPEIEPPRLFTLLKKTQPTEHAVKKHEALANRSFVADLRLSRRLTFEVLPGGSRSCAAYAYAVTMGHPRGTSPTQTMMRASMHMREVRGFIEFMVICGAMDGR